MHHEEVTRLKAMTEESLDSLLGWLEKNGWAGYDPYDLQATPYLLKLERLERNASIPTKIVRKILFHLRKHQPLIARKILRVKKEINAKGMGLFSSAFLILHEETGSRKLLDKSIECADWLSQNYNSGYPGMSWGYPFDWKSYVFIPRGTPSGVVTSTVGDAFWRLYKFTGNPEYLDVCKQICLFFTEGLNRDSLDDERLCFSYTPLDHSHIHNANLFVADFLGKVSKETGNKEFFQLANKAVNYTLSQVNPDGSIYYLGKDHAGGPKEPHLDNYHSGFEIRTLYSISKYMGDSRISEAVNAYLNFYLDHYFESDSIPRLHPDETYPVSIHSCSESIICLSILAGEHGECLKYLKGITPWVINNMQNTDGSYMFEQWKKGNRLVKIRIPYIRWAQAWMLRALAEHLRFLNRLHPSIN